MDSENSKLLRSAIRRGPVALFLGAGVNAKVIPLWPDLLKELLHYATDLRLGNQYKPGFLNIVKQSLSASSSSLSIYDQANLVKVLLGKQYLTVLKSIIYKKYDPNADSSNYKYLSSIVDLCQFDQIRAVVTYNYDDILLNILNQPDENGNGRRGAYAVWGQKQTVGDDGALPIFYIHGHLPRTHKAPNTDSAKVVLSLDEYFHNMMEPFSWQTTTQLHYLLNATCIFLGTSLDDINMLRMLRYAKHYSNRDSTFAILAMQSFDSKVSDEFFVGMGDQEKELAKKQMRTVLMRSKATLLRDAGVRVVFVPQFDDLSKKIDELKYCLNCVAKGQQND